MKAIPIIYHYQTRHFGLPTTDNNALPCKCPARRMAAKFWTWNTKNWDVFVAAERTCYWLTGQTDTFGGIRWEDMTIDRWCDWLWRKFSRFSEFIVINGCDIFVSFWKRAPLYQWHLRTYNWSGKEWVGKPIGKTFRQTFNKHFFEKCDDDKLPAKWKKLKVLRVPFLLPNLVVMVLFE